MRFIIVCGLPFHGDINLKSYAKKNMTQFFMMIINLTKSTVNNSIATIIPHQ